MTKHTIELADTFVIAKGPRDRTWRAEVKVDLAAIPADIVTDLLLHGLKQKVADAASGAASEAEALPAMQKAVDAILKGDWTSRVAGEGVDEFTATARAITRAMVKASVGAKSPAWVAFTGLKDEEQNAKLDANYAANEAALKPAVEAEIERKRAAREEKRGLAKATSFTI